MSSTKRKEKDPSQPPRPPLWKGADSLEIVYKLNERTLALLMEGATQHRELWSGLDAQATQRAARFPFVILDVHFTDEPWWQAASEPLGGCVEERNGALLWPAEMAEQLMSELLVFAWHTAKWDRRVGTAVVGHGARCG